MREDTLLRKSERGQREIAAATPTLSPKMRRLLIMADGRTSAALLARMVTGTDGMAMLAELVAMGYLEPVTAQGSASKIAATSAPVPPPRTSPPPAAAEVTTPHQQRPPTPTKPMPSAPAGTTSAAGPDAETSLAQVKSELRVFLTEVMGADIALVQDKLEAVNDAERLARFLSRCEDLVGNYGGARKAADFRARFSSHYA